MSAKHTPGPWSVDADGSVQVVAASGATVAEVYGTDAGERWANATLIAAAPDLLEACRGALAYLRARGEYDTSEQQAPLIAAIRAAEGEP